MSITISLDQVYQLTEQVLDRQIKDVEKLEIDMAEDGSTLLITTQAGEKLRITEEGECERAT